MHTQACISVAYVTPETLSWVYEPSKTVNALVKYNETATTEEPIKIYNSHFNWRGELFMACGMSLFTYIYIIC